MANPAWPPPTITVSYVSCKVPPQGPGKARGYMQLRFAARASYHAEPPGRYDRAPAQATRASATWVRPVRPQMISKRQPMKPMALFTLLSRKARSGAIRMLCAAMVLALGCDL